MTIAIMTDMNNASMTVIIIAALRTVASVPTGCKITSVALYKHTVHHNNNIF
jgi:hypothetical protein